MCFPITWLCPIKFNPIRRQFKADRCFGTQFHNQRLICNIMIKIFQSAIRFRNFQKCCRVYRSVISVFCENAIGFAAFINVQTRIRKVKFHHKRFCIGLDRLYRVMVIYVLFKCKNNILFINIHFVNYAIMRCRDGG